MGDHVIISNRSDLSTNDIIDWIDYLQGTWTRFNGENFVDDSLVEINLTNDSFDFALGDWKGSQEISNKIWFRRFFPHDYHEELKEKLPTNEADILTNVFGEINTVFKFVLDQENDTGIVSKRSINKLEGLSKAKKHGIAIPETLVTTSKIKVAEFLRKHKRIIMKSLSDSMSFNSPSFSGAVYTTEIKTDMLNDFEDRFFVTLFQKLLAKSFEIRSFFFDDSFYSMAIFSQNNEQTQVDFRNYDDAKPNRTVPYKLPEQIEQKLRNLMADLQLDTGSIDIVKTTNGEFVFLEVNPVGQFGMVSYPCNYRLEEIVAQKIMKNENR